MRGGSDLQSSSVAASQSMAREISPRSWLFTSWATLRSIAMVGSVMKTLIVIPME